ncbi:MAG TPA: hypothetical protein VJN89_16075 [Candidatus Acidoferrum sp.]|nr:hypothetical protein [Candidatus Acidoferrum sp.]
MDKDVWSIIAANKAISPDMSEPFNLANHLVLFPYDTYLRSPQCSIAVDFFVRAPDNHGNPNFECIANPQKRCHCNRATRFNLLPMASGESESDHVLLAVAPPLAEFLDALAKGFEESGVVHHAGTFTFA